MAQRASLGSSSAQMLRCVADVYLQREQVSSQASSKARAGRQYLPMNPVRTFYDQLQILNNDFDNKVSKLESQADKDDVQTALVVLNQQEEIHELRAKMELLDQDFKRLMRDNGVIATMQQQQVSKLAAAVERLQAENVDIKRQLRMTRETRFMPSGAGKVATMMLDQDKRYQEQMRINAENEQRIQQLMDENERLRQEALRNNDSGNCYRRPERQFKETQEIPRVPSHIEHQDRPLSTASIGRRSVSAKQPEEPVAAVPPPKVDDAISKPFVSEPVAKPATPVAPASQPPQVKPVSVQPPAQVEAVKPVQLNQISQMDSLDRERQEFMDALSDEPSAKPAPAVKQPAPRVEKQKAKPKTTNDFEIDLDADPEPEPEPPKPPQKETPKKKKTAPKVAPPPPPKKAAKKRDIFDSDLELE